MKKRVLLSFVTGLCAFTLFGCNTEAPVVDEPAVEEIVEETTPEPAKEEVVEEIDVEEVNPYSLEGIELMCDELVGKYSIYFTSEEVKAIVIGTNIDSMDEEVIAAEVDGTGLSIEELSDLYYDGLHKIVEYENTLFCADQDADFDQSMWHIYVENEIRFEDFVVSESYKDDASIIADVFGENRDYNKYNEVWDRNEEYSCSEQQYLLNIMNGYYGSDELFVENFENPYENYMP